MKRNIVLLSLVLIMSFVNARVAQAQVKQVEMHIAGYLCGN